MIATDIEALAALIPPFTLSEEVMAAAMLEPAVSRRFESASSLGGIDTEVFIVAPAVGMYPPLDVTLSYIATTLATQGYATTLVSFPGQYGNPGVFSVARSCVQLRNLLAGVEAPFLLFGICSGAITCLAGSIGNTRAQGVFCWDLSSDLGYSRRTLDSLAVHYNLTFCEATALQPVQAKQLIPLTRAPLLFAHPRRSYYTNRREQQLLAALARTGRAVCVCGLGHFPGSPRGSEQLFARVLLEWAAGRLHEYDRPA